VLLRPQIVWILQDYLSNSKVPGGVCVVASLHRADVVLPWRARLGVEALKLAFVSDRSLMGNDPQLIHYAGAMECE